jgi:hypothetical protein
MATAMPIQLQRPHGPSVRGVTIGLAALVALGGCQRVRDLVGADEEPAVDASADATPEEPSADAPGRDADAHTVNAGASEAPARKAGSVTKMMAAIESAKPRFPVYGVVKDGTRMYTGPNTTSAYLVAGGDDMPIPPHMRYGYGYGYRGTAPAEEIELGRAVRILEMKGDFFEVENITAEDDVVTCAPLQPELAHVRVRLWVPRDSLVPVLDKPTTVRVDEHIKITLAPGVPAFATDKEDEFNVRAEGITWKVTLPEIPTAKWHQPAPPMDFTGAVGTLGSWYSMTLDGKQFPPLGASGRQMGQLYGDAGGTTWTFSDEVKDGQSRVRVKNRCMDVEGVVVTDARAGAPAAGAVPATSRRRIMDRPPMVLAGTTLRWEDGSPAGIVVAPVTFAGTKRAQGQDVCFGITTEAGAPELCMLATEVEKAPAGASEADGLMITANAGWAVQTNVQHALSDQLWEHYEDVRECFRPHLKKRGAYNSASANVSLSVKTDGKVSVYWSSAWTMRGESTKLGKCVETAVTSWTVDEPPATDQSLSLYLAGTRT